MCHVEIPSSPEPGRHLSGFTPLVTSPISASAWIERRMAATAFGSAFASYAQRHASSWTFNDMERHGQTMWTGNTSLIPADLRHSCRGNIDYPERE
jgi:hypothetical protein